MAGGRAGSLEMLGGGAEAPASEVLRAGGLEVTAIHVLNRYWCYLSPFSQHAHWDPLSYAVLAISWLGFCGYWSLLRKTARAFCTYWMCDEFLVTFYVSFQSQLHVSLLIDQIHSCSCNTEPVLASNTKESNLCPAAAQTLCLQHWRKCYHILYEHQKRYCALFVQLYNNVWWQHRKYAVVLQSWRK